MIDCDKLLDETMQQEQATMALEIQTLAVDSTESGLLKRILASQDFSMLALTALIAQATLVGV